MPSTESKRIVAEFIDTTFNKHELEAMPRFVENDRLVAAASALVTGNPDLRLDVQHVIAEEDFVAIRVVVLNETALLLPSVSPGPAYSGRALLRRREASHRDSVASHRGGAVALLESEASLDRL